MKALLVFAACLSVSTAALWVAAGPAAPAAHLPDTPPAAAGPVLLSGLDFADAHGALPFEGRVRRLRDVVVRLSGEGYVQCYVRCGELARRDGHPVLDDVACAVFDPPEEGRPRLRITFRAPHVTGNVAELLNAPKDAPRYVHLVDGVVARDADGRTVATLEQARIDLTGGTVESGGPVVFRQPEREVEVTGVGLQANLDLRTVRIEKDVEIATRVAGGPVRFSCRGPAIVREVKETGMLRVTVEGGARLEHPLGTATCERITAELAKTDGRYVFARAVLEGEVDLELEPEQARDFEFAKMARVVVEGEHRITCDGPIRAVRRGPLPALGLGERVLDVIAGRAVLLLRRDEKSRLALEELRFADGIRIEDRAGGGLLRADLLTWVAEGGTLEASGDVEARTQDALVLARYVRVTAPDRDTADVLVRGVRRIEHVADGRLGPLGEDMRGRLHLAAGGPVHIAIHDRNVDFTASNGVTAWVDEQSKLEANRVAVAIRDGALVRFVGDGPATLRGRGAEIRGDSIRYENGEAVVTGAPASVRQGDARLLRAREFAYRDDKTFRASGDVFVRTLLGEKKGAWEIECGEADGALADGGKRPRRIVARGGVVARGPDGEQVEGTDATFDGVAGRAVLNGEPALVRRTDELVLRAPGFDLRLVDGNVAEARTRGAAAIEYRPAADAKTRGPAYARWRIALRGPAVFTDGALSIPAGAQLAGYRKGEEKPDVEADAGHVMIALVRRKGALAAERVTGKGGVTIRSRGARVVAQRLVYEAGGGDVDAFGDVRVEARDWPREVRFRHVVFRLTDDGIDLREASDIEVRTSGNGK